MWIFDGTVLSNKKLGGLYVSTLKFLTYIINIVLCLKSEEITLFCHMVQFPQLKHYLATVEQSFLSGKKPSDVVPNTLQHFTERDLNIWTTLDYRDAIQIKDQSWSE